MVVTILRVGHADIGEVIVVDEISFMVANFDRVDSCLGLADVIRGDDERHTALP